MCSVNIYTSNKLDTLSDKFITMIEDSTQQSVLQKEIVVVQNKGMSDWLSLNIAKKTGIAANLDFPFANKFIWDLFTKVTPGSPVEDAYTPKNMTWQIMKKLPSFSSHKEFRIVNDYWDNNDIKLFQISQKIADIFDQYLTYRPEMILEWNKKSGKTWQELLWQSIKTDFFANKKDRAQIRSEVIEKLRSSESIKGIYNRISVFGISYLPAFHINLLLELGKHTEVNFFLPNPCKEFWFDIVSPKKADKSNYYETGNELLSSMGVWGKEFIGYINELTQQPIENFEEYEDKSTLSVIKNDILNLRNSNNTQINDSSIQIHSCHNPLREIEILYNNLLYIFDKDPSITPKDVVVMTPDVDLYAPYIDAVFGTHKHDTPRIPYMIANRELPNYHLNTFLRILKLHNSRLEATEIIQLLEDEALTEKFKIFDLETLKKWITETKIFWGKDSEHKSNIGLPGIKQNTWKEGLNRLLLGYAMQFENDALFEDVIPYPEIESGEDLGNFIELMERIFNTIKDLNKTRTLKEWQYFLNDIITDFFAVNEKSQGKLHDLRQSVIELGEKNAVFEKKVSIDVVLLYFAGIVKKESRGFFTGNVTFCKMNSMQGIPFKVVYLIGMNEGVFPRNSQEYDFNIIENKHKLLDRSLRNEDKYTFLESLIGAEKYFYISYIGYDSKDNSSIPPSILVSELAEYIEENFGNSNILTKHKMYSFDKKYFSGENNFLGYSKSDLDACKNYISEFKFEKSFFGKEVAFQKSDEDKEITIYQLTNFFINPARYLLINRLGIYFPKEPELLKGKENFELNSLDNYSIANEIIDKRLQNKDYNNIYGILKAEGKLMHGEMGILSFNNTVKRIKTFVENVENEFDSFSKEVLDININGYHITGNIDNIADDKKILHYRYGKLNGSDYLRLWIRFVLWSYLTGKKEVTATLLGKEEKISFKAIEKPEDILNDLINLYSLGLTLPLKFMPKSAYVFTRNLLKKDDRFKAQKVAQKELDGNDYMGISGEASDWYFKTAFKNKYVIDKEFEDNAIKIFEPLIAHK